MLGHTRVTVRDGGPADAVGGVVPRWVALPESLEEVSVVLGACADGGLAVTPAGGRTKLCWAAPPERLDVLLDLSAMHEVLEHVAGDLVVRVQAGITTARLAEVLAKSGQELALDVPFPGATIGGTLAAPSPGPRAYRYGNARDLLLGVTVVLADGTIARAGGKVVKNVAGYDLGKLFTGSYGTLGVIAEATFRLHPLPADRRWLTFGCEGWEDAGALLRSQLEPSAVEIDHPAEGLTTVAALFEGSAAGDRAEAAREVLGGGEVHADAPSWWGRPPGLPLASLRCRVAPHVPEGVSVRGSLATGVYLASGVTDLDAWRSRLPADARLVGLAGDFTGDRWGPIPSLPLMRRVKERFDPERRMSPGRLAGGV
ncbi:FAD-binding protein [Herbidospora sp. NEAU-GS84]|uniref:FAD-binding protein n=1 Tax=Herbidospora solisilvae TaxID=2696284 RepID=A0A7C9NHI0_9ACTN|nr:FAD-binding oxidoreductase [Herbidospora solisilvae]NAS23138.1 FAD-binding protein [Herbidospora solisilvae]